MESILVNEICFFFCRKKNLIFYLRSISSILNGFLSFMCDTSATFGSIETTYAQKRKFAYDSLAFNIQDPIFCELFPDITNEIKKILEERTAKLSTINPINNDQEQLLVSSTLNSGSTSTSWFNNLIGNLMILALLAIFAIVVRFILNSTAEIQ